MRSSRGWFCGYLGLDFDLAGTCSLLQRLLTTRMQGRVAGSNTKKRPIKSATANALDLT